MSNNIFPISQSVYDSRTENPLQILQNHNYCFYLPDSLQMLLQLQNLKIYQILFMSHINRQSQPIPMNLSNENNQIPMFSNFGYNYNLFSPLNTVELSKNIVPQANAQYNIGTALPDPILQDKYFLNKKRSSSTDIEKENEVNINEKSEVKIEELKDEENIIKESNYKEKEEKNIASSLPSNQNGMDKKVEKKKGKKNKKIYEELLKDTFLEHIGESKKKLITIENESSEKNSKLKNNKSDIKNKNKNNICEEKIVPIASQPLALEDKPIEDQTLKDKNQKPKIKSNRRQKKKYHKKTLKNNYDLLYDLKKDKSNKRPKSNPKLTKIIFHEGNYENTKSAIDFMKYNFNFSVEEQYKTKKVITDYGQQHIDLNIINNNFYDRYNLNNQNLEKIEQKWSRKKFEGDNKELIKAINIIRDSFHGRKVDVTDEKCLNILKKYDYKIEEFLNKNKGN